MAEPRRPALPTARPTSLPGGRASSVLPAPQPIVRPPARPGTGVACLVLLAVTLGALGHVAVHLKSFEVAYALGKERRARGELEEERRKATLDVSMLKDPGRVMAIARDKLGLGPPAPTDIATPDALAHPRSLVVAPTKPTGKAETSHAPSNTGKAETGHTLFNTGKADTGHAPSNGASVPAHAPSSRPSLHATPKHASPPPAPETPAPSDAVEDDG